MTSRRERELKERIDAQRNRPARVGLATDVLKRITGRDQAPVSESGTVPQTDTVPRSDMPDSGTVPARPPEPYQPDTVPMPDTVSKHDRVPDSDTVSIIDTVRAVAGYTKVPNTVLHSLIQILPPSEFKVYVRLYCLSHGRGSETCTVGYERLADTVGLGRTTTKAAVGRLQTLGLVEKVGRENSTEKAPVYRVVVPGPKVSEYDTVARRGTVSKSGTVPKPGPNKETVKIHEMPAAGAPADVYEVRKIAARVREVHHGELGYTPERFRDDVCTALVGAGREAEGETIDEAIRGMIDSQHK